MNNIINYITQHPIVFGFITITVLIIIVIISIATRNMPPYSSHSSYSNNKYEEEEKEPYEKFSKVELDSVSDKEREEYTEFPNLEMAKRTQERVEAEEYFQQHKYNDE